jgi:hypothetical protein
MSENKTPREMAENYAVSAEGDIGDGMTKHEAIEVLHTAYYAGLIAGAKMGWKARELYLVPYFAQGGGSGLVDKKLFDEWWASLEKKDE